MLCSLSQLKATFLPNFFHSQRFPQKLEQEKKDLIPDYDDGEWWIEFIQEDTDRGAGNTIRMRNTE